MICNKKIIVTLSIFVSLLLLGTALNAEQKQKLPRSYGPLYLGMSVKEFKKTFTGVDIGRCVHCAEDELEADMCIKKEHMHTNLCDNVNPIKFTNAYIKFQPKELQSDSITCFFYKGLLYDIVMTDVKVKVDLVKKRYIKALGNPDSVDVWDTGLSQLRWKNSSTILGITFDTETSSKKDDSDFIEIRYTDLKILKQIPQEKGCGEDVEDSNKEVQGH